MPDARLQRTRDAYSKAELLKGCLCERLSHDSELIPIGAVGRCPEHPERAFYRGPSCDC